MTVTELETYAEKTVGTLLLLGLQTVNVEDSTCDQVYLTEFFSYLSQLMVTLKMIPNGPIFGT